MRLTDKQKRVLRGARPPQTVRRLGFHPYTKRDEETAYVMEEKGLIVRMGYVLTEEGEAALAKLGKKARKA